MGGVDTGQNAGPKPSCASANRYLGPTSVVFPTFPAIEIMAPMVMSTPAQAPANIVAESASGDSVPGEAGQGAERHQLDQSIKGHENDHRQQRERAHHAVDSCTLRRRRRGFEARVREQEQQRRLAKGPHRWSFDHG